MLLRVGYELVFECPQPTPMILLLNVHYSRASDLVRPDLLITNPSIPLRCYRDSFGNWCTRVVLPAGQTILSGSGVLRDTGLPDAYAPDAIQHPVEDLPDDVLVYLLGSRYCETDSLIQPAWDLFGHTQPGWARVQAICDYVHNHIKFGYAFARPTKTAREAFEEGRGVCRDFAHLGVAFCRAMNIPARYCSGYVSDVGLPPPYATMDFCGWFEAYLGGRWYTFDPRNNAERRGRVLMALGRDAADVAISTSFGRNTLTGFKVITEEVTEAEVAA